MVCYSNCMHHLQMLLLAVYEFSKSERLGNIDGEQCYPRKWFKKIKKD